MTIEPAAVRDRSVYLDANAFIAAFESEGDRSEGMWRVFDAIAEGRIGGVTSEVTLAEILPKPLSLGQEALARFYMDLLSGKNIISVVRVTRSILIETARLRSTLNTLKLPDAIHLATALRKHCTAMLSDDRRMPVPASLRLVRLASNSLDAIMGTSP